MASYARSQTRRSPWSPLNLQPMTNVSCVCSLILSGGEGDAVGCFVLKGLLGVSSVLYLL